MKNEFKLTALEEIGKVRQHIVTTTELSGKVLEKRDARESSFYNPKTGKYRVFTKTAFAKVFTPRDSDVPNLCSVLYDEPKDLGLMMLLINEMDGNNMLCCRDNKSHKALPVNAKLLYKMIGGNEKVACRFVKRMTDKGIIKKYTSDKTDRFFVNPLYSMTDSGISLTLYKLFKEELDPYLTKQAIEDFATLMFYDEHPDEVIRLKEVAEKEREESMRMFEIEFDAKREFDGMTPLEQEYANEESHSIAALHVSVVAPGLAVAASKGEIGPAHQYFIDKILHEFDSHRDFEQLIADGKGLLAYDEALDPGYAYGTADDSSLKIAMGQVVIDKVRAYNNSPEHNFELVSNALSDITDARLELNIDVSKMNPRLAAYLLGVLDEYVAEPETDLVRESKGIFAEKMQEVLH